VKSILVRIGIDHSYGQWNGPVSTQTREFVYVPIPENKKHKLRNGMDLKYSELSIPLSNFCSRYHLNLHSGLNYPESALRSSSMHLDPDFEYLTYGDNGARRGSQIAQLGKGDLLVFYSGMQPIEKVKDELTYAIVGLFVVDDVIMATEIPADRMHENAHTRKVDISAKDIVVRGIPKNSGRLKQCIVIGEYRDRAYRVRNDILKAWGGLSVKDGYIQRSAVPPRFLDASKFYEWFLGCNPIFERNNF
jgi:hypothetical protein